MAKPATIIIPVYADWPSLADCLQALKKTVNFKQHQLLMVNDAGPEADSIEKNIKKSMSGQSNWHYFRNPKNLGFVGTCNRAVLELDKTGNDVLLLNSDTIPTRGWIEELQVALEKNPRVAVVSARSNNASIATIPLSQAVKHGLEDSKTAYAIFKRISPKLPRYYNSPVGLGYCMLIRRSVIDEFGLFDEIFKKGYGEEVDFCRRIMKHGWRCALANRAFVFHLEARSFTNERKQKLIDSHNKIIWQRYPEYRQEVRDWMDKTVPAETELEKAAGIHVEPRAMGPRRWLKNWPFGYRLARKIYRRINGV